MKPIDRRSIIPLYYQLAESLREKIHSGEFGIGDQIPTERDLMQAHSLSRNTVRQALSILANEGLIIRDHGHGTYVSNLSTQFHYMLDTFVENSELLRRAGYTPTVQQISTQKLVPDKLVCKELLLQKGEEVICHTMIFLGDDRPAMYTQDFLPLKMVGENNPPVGGEGFWDYLERCSNNHLDYVWVDISPVEAAGDLAAIFQCPEGTPVLLFKETFLDGTQKNPIAFSLNYFNREVLSFRLLTKRG
jgi:DNA-binding GntR family transcriptional regulator